ncbi:Fic family protein [Candidatus Saccharibacteria bacterium]|nr:Fic family protein [Candidatus Saccharibacteria bacterium]
MSDFIDPYIDQETGVLRNRVGAKTWSGLQKTEADIIGISQIALVNIPRTNDLAELQAIHKALFGKIYDWAGQLRTVDIKKGSEEYFLSFAEFDTGTRYVFGELKEQNYLAGLEKEQFVERLAYFYEQLNYIHPFREGNGRTQRVFWSRVAKDAGYTIGWKDVVGDELDKASQIGREKGDIKPLVKMFSRIVSSI